MRNITERSLILTALIMMGLSTFVDHTLGQQPRRPTPKSTRSVPHPAARSRPKPQHKVIGPKHAPEPYEEVRPDMFAAPDDKLPPPPAQPVALPVKPPPPAPVVRNPLADYAYTGTVSVNNEIIALIECRPTRQGWYVKAGDRWQNCRVLTITEDEVTLQDSDGVHVLSKSNRIDVIPLDAPPANPAAPTKEAGAGGEGATSRAAVTESSAQGNEDVQTAPSQQTVESNRTATANTMEDRFASTEAARVANREAQSRTMQQASEMRARSGDADGQATTFIFVSRDTITAPQTRPQ